MNNKKRKLIKKYIETRFFGNEGVNLKSLVKISYKTYEKFNPKQQLKAQKEMDTYLQAIKKGEIKPGDPIYYRAINNELSKIEVKKPTKKKKA